MKKVNMAYIAGLIDGEGYIGLTRARGSFRPRVIISNCNLSLLENVKEIVGGYIVKKSDPRENCMQGYNLTILRTDGWLKNVIPFLVGKKKKALLFLEAKIILGKRKKMTNRAGDYGKKRLEEINLLLRKKEWFI